MSIQSRAISAPSSAVRMIVMALSVLLALSAVLFSIRNAAAEEMDRGDIEKIVREYLVQNPEVIAEALTELDKRQKAAEAAARQAALDESSDILFNSARQVVLGNPKGSITLVEFFDYNCGYCKRAFGDMTRLLEEEPELRMVLKEFPVLGEGSLEAAKVAVAVNMLAPEKYADFHQALLMTRGRANKDSALKAATDVGLSAEEIADVMSTGEIGQTIEESYTLANRLGLTGTPSYVIGNEVIPGAVGYSQLKAKVDALKTCGETAC
jgi:protein-disulfide isomerase